MGRTHAIGRGRATVLGALVGLLLGVTASAASGAGMVYVEDFQYAPVVSGLFPTSSPGDIAVDASGAIFVVDSTYDMMFKFTLAGGTLTQQWAVPINKSYGIAVDTTGGIYVADSTSDKISRYEEASGTAHLAWSFSDYGVADEQFRDPLDIAVDTAGDVYITCGLNHRVQKFTPNENGLTHVWTYGSHGSNDVGLYDTPMGVTTDADGAVYIADMGNDRIQKFEPGSAIPGGEWALGAGSGAAEFNTPMDLAVGGDGVIYIADAGNARTQVFDQTGRDGAPEHVASYRLSNPPDSEVPDSIAIGTGGTIWILDGNNKWLQRWFDPHAIPAGGSCAIETLTVHSSAARGNLLQVSDGRTLNVSGRLTVDADATVEVDAAEISASAVALRANGLLQVNGQLNGRTLGQAGSEIRATGLAVLGDPTAYDGFVHNGKLDAGGHTVMLKSMGPATLGGITLMEGGAIEADNGVYFAGGGVFWGHGEVRARVAVALGAVIEPNGALTIGDPSRPDGFASDGTLLTGPYVVTVEDANVAVLGSLTQLGNYGGAGVIAAANGFLLGQGRNLIGVGNVMADFVNQGDVTGEGPNPGEQIIFDAGFTVSGIGSFTNVLFNGAYAPGNSPAITHQTDSAYGDDALIEMEIAGTQAGTEHDRIVFAGQSVQIDGDLRVLLADGYEPEIGDSFTLFDFAALHAGPTGTFDNVVLPELADGHAWDSRALYTAGTLTVGPGTILTGDANYNGWIDDNDLSLLLANWTGSHGSGETWATGDFSADGAVDDNDLSLLLANWTGTPQEISVPEPTALSLLAASLFALTVRRRR